MKLNYLVLPGWQDSGPEHWQGIWLKKNPTWSKVQMRDWNFPEKNEWVDTLSLALDASGPNTVVIAHSLGCATLAHLQKEGGHKNLAGAFLVSPSDPARSDFPKEIVGFAPMPIPLFTFPSVVVTSQTDPFIPISTARIFAEHWGSKFYDIGDAGHINVAAGYGEWSEGEKIFVNWSRDPL